MFCSYADGRTERSTQSRPDFGLFHGIAAVSVFLLFRSVSLITVAGLSCLVTLFHLFFEFVVALRQPCLRERICLSPGSAWRERIVVFDDEQVPSTG